jgi:hypothetical protein
MDIVKNFEQARQISPVVSRRVNSKDLKGFGKSTLEVAPDQTAVQVMRDGEKRVLKEGQHTVRNWFTRHVTPFPTIGLVSTSEVALSTHLTNLLAGGANGELLDGDLRYGVAVNDAALFFDQAAKEGAEVRAVDLSRLLESRVQAALIPLLRQYAVQDLIGGGAAAVKLLDAFRQTLSAALAEFGLTLKWVQTPVLYRAADAVQQAQRAAELRQKLRQIEVDDKMDELQKQTELDDFRKQLSADATLAASAKADDMGAALDEQVSAIASHVLGKIEERIKSPGYFVRLALGEGKAASPKIDLAKLRVADSHLRAQVEDEMSRLYHSVREARSKVFAKGNTALALQLKELERKIEDVKEEIARLSPSYLTLPDLTFANVQRALADDDKVLARAQALADVAQETFTQTLTHGGDAAQWRGIETQLAAFKHQYSARARVPQA